MRRAICRHCGRAAVNRPRGLCWGCYYAPGVKDLYPPGTTNPATAKYANRGHGNLTGARPLPPRPTCQPPGSEAKVAVLRARVAAGLSPFHPADARYAGDPRPIHWLLTGGVA